MGQPVRPEKGNAKPSSAHVLQYRYHDGRFVSFFGDLHPSIQECGQGHGREAGLSGVEQGAVTGAFFHERR